MKNTEKNQSKVIGAEARAKKLTPERRSEIAKLAAEKRHQLNRPLKSIRKGSFREKFGIDVECYVLNDESHTAVIVQTGISIFLGLGDGGSRLPRFLFSAKMSPFIGPELREKIEKPIIFHIVNIGQNTNKSNGLSANGYSSSTLIQICLAIIKADSQGVSLNSEVVAQANVIISASALYGIEDLIYRITGFSRTDEEAIQAYKKFVAEEAKKYEPEFPNELYLAWARLYGIPTPERGRNWKHKHLTLDHIYFPLAKSDGKLLALLRDAKSNNEDRNKKLFQFLNEIGARALRVQLGRVLEMAESSEIAESYEAKIETRFGSGQQRLNFNAPIPPTS